MLHLFFFFWCESQKSINADSVYLDEIIYLPFVFANSRSKRSFGSSLLWFLAELQVKYTFWKTRLNTYTKFNVPFLMPNLPYLPILHVKSCFPALPIDLFKNCIRFSHRMDLLNKSLALLESQIKHQFHLQKLVSNNNLASLFFLKYLNIYLCTKTRHLSMVKFACKNTTSL